MTKFYGIQMVYHPQGWYYIVAFNTKEMTLKDSTILIAWDTENNIIENED